MAPVNMANIEFGRKVGTYDPTLIEMFSMQDSLLAGWKDMTGYTEQYVTHIDQ